MAGFVRVCSPGMVEVVGRKSYADVLDAILCLVGY